MSRVFINSVLSIVRSSVSRGTSPITTISPNVGQAPQLLRPGAHQLSSLPAPLVTPYYQTRARVSHSRQCDEEGS